MRLLFIGDIVGRPGRRALKENLPGLLQELDIDFVVANGENAAGGNGITREVARELLASGIDVITMGNHVWDHKEIFDLIEQEKRILRPANYPPGVPGTGFYLGEDGHNRKVAVLNLAGRVFMSELDCPFRKVDQLLSQLGGLTRVILVDFHAEATSEKMAMGWYLAGRVSAVCGTHTHVQTADERILPGGTAYITDVGMTGPRDSVIGVKKELVLNKFLTQLPRRFEVAAGPYQFNAVVIDVDDDSGEAREIRRIQNYE
ncbi:TIGR00282 family metallophosphoesterase [Desulfofundulus sp.]|uniref:TIGR00282 family metallophosphoesterase n=1 Tax=Desulfofundulus sp. TaxID=2282750 RepID=UPI003C734316